MSGSRLEVIACPPEAREAALQVLYRRFPESLRPGLIAEVSREVHRGLIDLSGLWIARETAWFRPGKAGGPIVGAMLTQPLAGRAAAVWAPEVVASWHRGRVASALIRAALSDLRSRGFRLAQAVLDESAGRQSAVDLARGGLPRVTELLYMERDTRLPLAGPRSPEGPPGRGPVPTIHWTPYDPADPAEFLAVLEGTYVASLDMPELDEIRSTDDVLESHRSAGRFVPDRWRLGRVAGEPEAAAVLLLSEVPDRGTWEVVYLGLTLPARRRGIGRAAIAEALKLARPHAARLELAVDIRNLPACRLYHATGFVPFDRRSVHLVVFPEPSSRDTPTRQGPRC